jgi:hypothetical protein
MPSKKTRAQWAAEAKHPGKFEGEAAHVPYYWDLYLDGMYEEDDGEVVTFEVVQDDLKIFPELKSRAKVCLSESSDGFVQEVSCEDGDDEPDLDDDEGEDDDSDDSGGGSEDTEHDEPEEEEMTVRTTAYGRRKARKS